jgi:hypothetical protein
VEAQMQLELFNDFEEIVIFRRYRRDPKTGVVLDARRFGKRAWPIRLRRPKQ